MKQLTKIPPQAIELEEAVLGSIILEAECIHKVVDIITPESFYKNENQTIARALFDMLAKNKNIDALTLSDYLKALGKLDEIGGLYRISTLTTSIGSTANIEQHARIIQEKYLMRQIIRLNSEFQNRAFNENTDVFDLLSEIIEKFTKLTGFNNRTIKHISESLKGLMQQIEFNLINENPLLGIPTGISEFDTFSGGMQKGDLIVIAGETSNGKTALALNIAHHAANCNYRVAVYSAEMTDRQLAARVIASDCQLSAKALQYYKLNDYQLDRTHQAIGKAEKLPIYIDEMESTRYDYLERSIRIMVLRQNIDLVVIDYLQLIKSNDPRKENTAAMAEIANNIKMLARTLKIPIILISQLTRDRQNPKPSMGRLKGSGDIENAADIAWLLWQPAKYEYQNFECKTNTYQAEGLAHHIIAKGRNIGVTEFVTRFDGPTTKFTDYSAVEQMSFETPY